MTFSHIFADYFSACVHGDVDQSYTVRQTSSEGYALSFTDHYPTAADWVTYPTYSCFSSLLHTTFSISSFLWSGQPRYQGYLLPVPWWGREGEDPGNEVVVWSAWPGLDQSSPLLPPSILFSQ